MSIEIKVQGPFTPDQVTALNTYQHNGQFHPFTCGNDSSHRVLLATENGWVCEDCGYTQLWAHGFMTSSSKPAISMENIDKVIERTTAINGIEIRLQSIIDVLAYASGNSEVSQRQIAAARDLAQESLDLLRKT